MKDLVKYIKKITLETVKEGRKEKYNKVKESMSIFKKKKYSKKNDIVCNMDWDDCIDIKKQYEGNDFVVYEKKENMEIIEEYYLKKYKRNNSAQLNKRLKNYGELINKYYVYDRLMVQRRQHECILAKRKNIKSAININKNMSKNVLDGKYIFGLTKKIKKKGEDEIEKNEIKIDDDESSDNEENNFFMNTLYYDL